MPIDHRTLLFFDASCLIAAAGSPTGGSGFLLSLCVRSLLRGAVSQAVLLEAERNIQGKLGAEALERYHRLLVLTPLALLPLPPHGELVRCAGLVGEKDAHVLAAALAARAPFLVTLDRLLAERINQAELGKATDSTARLQRRSRRLAARLPTGQANTNPQLRWEQKGGERQATNNPPGSYAADPPAPRGAGAWRRAGPERANPPFPT
jgi:predicted nucleic acid-binding protein